MVSALMALGQEEVSPVTLSIINWIEERIDALRGAYTMSRQYYAGDHKVELTDRQKKFLGRNLVFRDNVCEVVVDSVAERLEVTAFKADNDEVSSLLWDWWKANRMDHKQTVTHTETTLLGDGYVLVDWDYLALRPRFHFQEAEMIIPHYDNAGDMVWLSKKWTEVPELGQPEITRMNIYYPDRIEKLRSEGRVWRPVLDEGETEWPVPWVDSNGKPLGLPVVHFRNSTLSDDFGQSEIADVIPLQDLLNKQLVDMTAIADIMGFPQRWMVDMEVSNKSELEYVPGSLWDLKSDGGDAKGTTGQFEAAPMLDILKAIEMLVEHVSMTSRTPRHLFHLTGEYPSGEAMKTAEAGLVSKVKKRQVDFGNSWEDVMQMAVKVNAVFGGGEPGSLPETSIIDTIWADPETRNETNFLQGLAIKKDKLGVPQEQIWREMGYSQQAIDQMQADQDLQRTRDVNIGSAILRDFEQGQGGGFEQDGGP